MTIAPLVSTLALALLASFAALVAYELIAVAPLRLRARRMQRETVLLAKALDRMRVFAERSSAESKSVRAQLVRLDEKIAQLNLRSDARSYEQAISLAEQGAEGINLSRALGLTRGEAELVRLLHGGRSQEIGSERG